MVSKTNKPDASTSPPTARSARSKAPAGAQGASTLPSSGLVRRSGRPSLLQLGLGFGIVVMLACTAILTVSLSIQSGILDKFPLTNNYQTTEAMQETMPLVMVGYLSRENGGPVMLMQDRVVGCQYFVVPEGSIYPRLRENGTPYCVTIDQPRRPQ